MTPKQYFIELTLTELAKRILLRLLPQHPKTLAAVHEHRLSHIHVVSLLKSTTCTAARRSCFLPMESQLPSHHVLEPCFPPRDGTELSPSHSDSQYLPQPGGREAPTVRHGPIKHLAR